MLSRLTVAAVLLAALVGASPADAVRVEVRPSALIHATGIAGAPDGSAWMVSQEGDVAHIPAAGQTYSRTWGFPYGPRVNSPRWHDGALWVVRNNQIERRSAAGSLHPFDATPSTSGAYAPTIGPDKSLWFLQGADKVGRVTGDGKVQLFSVSSGILGSSGNGGASLTAGRDGHMWFTAPTGNVVGRITTAGTVTEFPMPAGLKWGTGITAGLDGNLYIALDNALGRVNAAGIMLTAQLSGGQTDFTPSGPLAGPDGSIWFTDRYRDRLGRLRTNGHIEFHSGNISPGSQPTGLIKGEDGTIWFYGWQNGTPGRVFHDPPRAETGEASLLGEGRMRLSGTAGGRGIDTSVHFEYGPTTAYGATTERAAASEAEDGEPVSGLTGALEPGTTYHYRVVATNAVATTVGEDRTFTTAAVQVPPTPAPIVTGPPDDDGDGYPAGVDCDDRNRAVHPGAYDKPGNQVDEDCAGGDARHPRFAPRIDATWDVRGKYVVFDRLAIDYLPATARLKLTCKGSGCRAKAYSATISRETRKLSLLKHLKRSRLRRNAVVELRLSRPGHVTTITRWTVGPPPKQTVTCLAPGAKKAGKCD